MAGRKFYAIFGLNAVGVADKWYKVNRARKYIKSFNNKSFDTFEEAEMYALEQASLLLPYNFIPPLSLECNDVVFLKDMMRI